MVSSGNSALSPDPPAGSGGAQRPTADAEQRPLGSPARLEQHLHLDLDHPDHEENDDHDDNHADDADATTSRVHVALHLFETVSGSTRQCFRSHVDAHIRILHPTVCVHCATEIR